MITHAYGFDWEAYTNLVMPAFARWLVEGDAIIIHQLYQQTRCALEEQFIPSAMQQSCTWPRAKAYVDQLPRGFHANREYQLLCSAEQFTRLSDKYMHRHVPQLCQNSDAIRVLWGAIVEKYCQLQIVQFEVKGTQNAEGPLSRNNVAPLQRPTSFCVPVYGANEPIVEQSGDVEAIQVVSDAEGLDNECRGVEIGRHPAILHLRGWLATRSVRAMALFELLTCGRRRLPFGYRAGEPYEAYIGYLTPDEVCHLADCLRDEQPPDYATAESDYTSFRQQQSLQVKEFRMIDEVLPAHADSLMEVVRMAEQCGSGLICSAG